MFDSPRLDQFGGLVYRHDGWSAPSKREFNSPGLHHFFLLHLSKRLGTVFQVAGRFGPPGFERFERFERFELLEQYDSSIIRWTSFGGVHLILQGAITWLTYEITFIAAIRSSPFYIAKHFLRGRDLPV